MAKKSGSSYGCLTLLHFWTWGIRWCQVNTTRGKDKKHLNRQKMITWYCSIYNQITCLKIPIILFSNLMMNNLQLVLINMLIQSFLNTKVSQGSVATRLKCDGIFNNQFVSQSLLVWWWKNFKNQSIFAEVMGKNQLSCFLTQGNCLQGQKQNRKFLLQLGN